MGPRLPGRGYRCRNGPHGPVIAYQSELFRRMAMERVVEIVGGFAGPRDRSFREIATAQSTRTSKRHNDGDRRRPFLRAAPRAGADHVVALVATAPGLGPDEPFSRRLLRAPGSVGRGENRHRAAACPDPGSGTERGQLARPGAARVLPVGPAA